MSRFAGVDAIPGQQGLPSHPDALLGGHRMPFQKFPVHEL